MDSQKVDLYLMTNAKYFQGQHLNYIREKLLAADDSKWGMLQTADLKDPTTSILVSVFAGSLGIDRFIIGDTGLGVGKLITCGGLGIWYIVDLFLIMDATKAKNMDKLQMFL
jgi:TM2 domain-containing membrane protein YozV